MVSARFILVTRPQPEASRLAAALRAQGHAVLEEPLLSFTPVIHGMEALAERCRSTLPYRVVLTSRHAVSCLAQATTRRDMPLLVVGPATAEAACQSGFQHISVGDENGRAGAALLASHLQHMPSVPVLYPSARHSAASTAFLNSHPLLERIICYDTTEAASFSPSTREQWEAIGTVTLLSRRTADHFLHLARQASLTLSHMHACVFSPAIAEALAEEEFASLHWPDAQTIEALLRCIKNYSAEA